ARPHDRAKDLAPKPRELASGLHQKKRPPFPRAPVPSGDRPPYLAPVRPLPNRDLSVPCRRTRGLDTARRLTGRHLPPTHTPPRTPSLGEVGEKSTPYIEPQIRGESFYDRVSSMLMAVVVGAFLIFAWLSIIWATTGAYASRVTMPVEIVEGYGGGGGSPEG